MDAPFNFSQLKDIYFDALKSEDKTLIFESHIGKGRFLFMMFLSKEDRESRDKLFIYLRNINRILSLIMYGSHKQGVFNVYIKDDTKKMLIEELQLTPSGESFDFENFLYQLNNSIPTSMPMEVKINKLRQNCDTIRSLNVIDEADKTVLIGERKLTKGKPQDKTLRKLYMYTDGDPQDIALLIELLKKANMTVAWTSSSKSADVSKIRAMINNLKDKTQ